MTLREFWNSLWEDEKARYIIIKQRKKFEDIEKACSYFLKDTEPKYTL